MIASIRIRGIGPIIDQTLSLDARGITEIHGRSEVGKTTVLDAICFCLWGIDRAGKPLDNAVINDECDAAEVTIELSSGSSARRRLEKRDTGRGATSRSLVDRDGVEHKAKTERAWRPMIKALGEDVGALRCILAPFAWVPLAQSHGGKGRDFRDLLSRILPKTPLKDVISEIMRAAGNEFREGDPVHPGDAEQHRRDANRTRDETSGRAASLRELDIAVRYEANQEIGPSLVDFHIAESISRALDAWVEFEAARERHVEHEENRARAVESLDGWINRRRTLGDEPPDRADATENAIEVLRDLEAVEIGISKDGARLHARAREAANVERRAIRAHAEALNEIAASDSQPDTCPNCDQSWPKSDDYEANNAAAARAESDAKHALDNAVKARAAAEKMAKSHDDLVLAAAGDTYTARERVSTVLRDDPKDVWKRRSVDLGPEPPAPAEPQERPKEPGEPCPASDEVAQAKRTIDTWHKSAGQREERARNAGRAGEMLAGAEAAVVRATAEAVRLQALVEAVRLAPSIMVERQLGALGDLGPVALELRSDGGIDITIDNRPWYLASDGRKVVADVWLRAGLRTVVGVSYLPLVVDCAQNVGGQAIPAVSPAIWLRTTNGGLEVRYRGAI